MCEGKAPLLWTKGAASPSRSPSTPKNFIRGMLPAEKAEEMTGVERDGDFSLHPKPSPPFKAPLFPFRKTCSAYQARRAAVDGLGASRDAQHDMARCPRRQAAGGAGMADTLRAAFLLSLPRLAFFCPERRKARGARLPMSGFWGEGEFEGEGRFLPQEKGALPLSQPARQIINKTKTGRLLKRRPVSYRGSCR